MNKKVVIVEGLRTPMGNYLGSLSDLNATELAALAIKSVLSKTSISPSEIDHVVIGNVIQSSNNAIYLARHASLKCGIPIETPALVVNRLCGSGIEAITFAAKLVLLNEARTVVAGGTENMSQVPHCIWGARKGFKRLGAGKMEDYLLSSLFDSYCGYSMAQTSDNLAKKYGISRQDQDHYAFSSYKRAKKALEKGIFEEEITPVKIDKKGTRFILTIDEHIRETTVEELSKLSPAFGKDSAVTAGNASGIVDGAAITVVTDETSSKNLGIKPLGEILAWEVVGVEPKYMGIGPVPAIKKLLSKLSLKIDDVDLFEINEAFAGQILAVLKELELDREKVNVNGGAIALGHPLGATGTRLVITLLKELRRKNLSIGVASACIGGGQGIAIAVRSYD